MDVDIDDILKDFDKEVRSRSSNEGKLKQDDLHELTQSWISERVSPELLEYKHSLIERIMERIRVQIEFIESNSIELQTQERDIKLQLMIVETELDRVSFLLRSYLRTRLSKIDKFTIHIRNNEDILKRLSESEITYMENHFAALLELYNSLFLGSLPQQLQALDDTGGGISMIEVPDLKKPVFVKVVNDIPYSVIAGDEEIDLVKNSIYLLRYSAVQRFVHSGDVVLT